MLTDVFDAMVADFKARSCPATLHFGESNVANHREPPSVVIYPAPDSYSPKGLIVQGPLPLRGANPRPLLTRLQGGTANIWGAAPNQRDPAAQTRADFGVLDALINQTVAALHNAAGGIFQITGGDMLNDESVSGRGLVYEMQFVVAVPILDIPWPNVAITATQPKTFQESPIVTVSTDLEFED